jgi:hypothetical protein
MTKVVKTVRVIRFIFTLILSLPMLLFSNAKAEVEKQGDNNCSNDKTLICHPVEDGKLKCSDSVEYSQVGSDIQVITKEEMEIITRIRKVRDTQITDRNRGQLESEKACINLMLSGASPTVPTKTIHTTTPPPNLTPKTDSSENSDSHDEFLKNAAEKILKAKK